jgi:hypothetical protein
VFPNVIDYWGPDGLVFLRNPQIRWTPIRGSTSFAVAIEQPANDIDTGIFSRIFPDASTNVTPRNPFPDFTAQFRHSGARGHVQVSGIVRRVGFETLGQPDNEPKGHDTGWGVHVAGTLKTAGRDRLLLSLVYGHGIANYMNDGGGDLAPQVRSGRAEEVAMPLLGIVAYYDHYWNDKWSSSVGWARTKVDNRNLQTTTAYYDGQYASANVLYNPVKDLLTGVEYLWGQRVDKGRAKGHDNRLQITVKYSFSFPFSL